VAATVVCFCKFESRLKQFRRNDIGQLQKWIEKLIIALFLFNDPLCLLKDKMGMSYAVLQSIFESAFITLLMFFWLMLVHSIAFQNNIFSINKK